MTFRFIQGIAVASLVMSTVGRGEGILITCASTESCEVKMIATIRVNGRDSVRSVTAKDVTTVTSGALRASKERKIDTLVGIVRDSMKGPLFAYSSSAERSEAVFPGGSIPKDAAAVTSMWESARIAYRNTLKAKAEEVVSSQNFVGYMIGKDGPELAVTFARRLVAQPVFPLRAALLRASVAFGNTAPSYKSWRDGLVSSVRDGVSAYRKQDGDPRQLLAVLNEAISGGEILVQVEPMDANYAKMLSDAKREREIVQRKTTVAGAFAAAGLWDEYLSKVHELGPTKWAIPEMAPKERTALMDSAKAHRALSETLAEAGFLDRAFDEAERAYRRDPCSADVSIHFNNIRPQFVERNSLMPAADISNANRSALQQIERQLRSLDTGQLQQESYRKLGYDLISRGDATDKTYAPFQLAKAQFLRGIGRLSDALDVAIDIERHLGLDARQREELLSIDANLSLGLSASRNKSLEDAKKNLDDGHFREALDATTPGLAADPRNPALLLSRASAAASLRQPEEALKSIGTLLEAGNSACADTGLFEKAFSLRDALSPASDKVAIQSAEPGDGTPSWVSGKRYQPGRLYYDPMSLAFLPRLTLVSALRNPLATTSFTWEGLRLVNIQTSLDVAKGKAGAGQTTFYVEPEYAPGTLRMTAIGPRAIQEGKRISYPVTFWNDPRVNVDLLQKSGRLAARGWAGNPVFDPLVWNGIYLFDFKYDSKGRVIEAVPVPDETRGRSFAETLTVTWDDATDRLKSISSKSYRRTMEYDKRGRLVAEEAIFNKAKERTSYQYSGDGLTPRRATSQGVFDKQQRLAGFQPAN